MAVGSEDSVWGLNSTGLIYRFDTSIQNWEPIPGILTQITVDFDATVWGLNGAAIFRFNPQSETWQCRVFSVKSP